MGMSASQVRLLTITKRIHEVENEAERTQNQKMLLGLQSDEAYEEYLAAMEKKDIEYSWFNGNTGNFEWEDLDLTKLYNAIGTEYRLKVKNLNHIEPVATVTSVQQGSPAYVDASNNTITLDGIAYHVDSSTQSITHKGIEYPIVDHSGTLAIQQYSYTMTLNGGSVTGVGNATKFNITQGSDTYTIFNYNSGTTSYTAFKPSTEEYIECDTLDEACAVLNITDASARTDKVVFRDLVYNAYAIIEAKIYDEDTQHRDWKETSVATNVGLREKTDDEELAKAEANYEAALRRIDKKEEQYDKDLAKYDQERKALTSQLETLKTCIKENIDRTFKIFQG